MRALMVLIFVVLCELEAKTSVPKTARIAVLLPADDSHLFSIKRVAPALEHAKEVVKRRQILPHTKINVRYGDSRCSNADGMNEAVAFYATKSVDVFFGPCCDYAVAPVARQVAFWNIPLITAGAMAKDFGHRMNKEYSVLTRVGANFNSLGDFLIKVFNHFKWERINLLYNPNGQEYVMHRFCHIAADGVHYAFRTRTDLGNFTQIFKKFHSFEEIRDSLSDKIGSEFGDNGCCWV